MFLKAKNIDGTNTLIAVSDISAVVATKEGTVFSMKNGDMHTTVMGMQAVTNRLADLDLQVA